MNPYGTESRTGKNIEVAGDVNLNPQSGKLEVFPIGNNLALVGVKLDSIFKDATGGVSSNLIPVNSITSIGEIEIVIVS